MFNSTSFGVLDPEQAELWHPTKNGELTPYDVSTGSGKRVWFKCPKGDDHEWESTVAKRKIRRNEFITVDWIFNHVEIPTR